MERAVRGVVERVRERVRSGGDPADGAERIARDEVREYIERANAGFGEQVADEDRFESAVLAELTGYGPLQRFIDDPAIEEIWINAPGNVFIASEGTTRSTGMLLDTGATSELIERMLQPTGRRVDVSAPFADATLPDGSRLHVAVADVVRGGVSINIRKFLATARDMPQLVGRAMLTNEAADYLIQSASGGANILVSGATHTGKTTLMNALLSATADGVRIVTVEETFELRVDGADVVSLQGRRANLEGTGEIGLRRLVSEAMRMRPDRLVIGEVRGGEALDLLIALNSGVPGMCTVHASSATDAIAKLTLLPLLAGGNIDARFVVPTVARAIDVVVHCERLPGGERQVAEIAVPGEQRRDGSIATLPVFVRRASQLVRVSTEAISEGRAENT